jgi:hypothetical protein
MPSSRTRTRRLGTSFERLEDRTVPTAWGVPWADPSRLTLSFAPDGTPTPVGDSRLSSAMSAAPGWQRETLRAFESWAAVTNVNFGVTADGGQPLGARGAVQGDSRFGDVRIAAAPAAADNELAAASPFGWVGSTYAGDVLFDSTDRFAVGNAANAYDVYSVAAHEAGHVLGLDHSADPQSVMNEGYGYRTGLSAGDVARVQALYGTRLPDAFDAAAPNDTRATASVLPRVSSSSQQATGDITTAADADYYKFTVDTLAALGGVTVRLKASGVSLLVPSVTVYDAAGRTIAAGVAADPLRNDLTVWFPPFLLGGTYTVKVAAADPQFAVGGYKLAVDGLSLFGTLAPLTTAVGSLVDGHTDDSLLSALGLVVQPPAATPGHFEYTYRGTVEDTRDVDTFRVHSPAGGPSNLNVLAWGTDATPVDPRVRVFDAAGRPVAFHLLANDDGLASVQVVGAAADADYYVQVSGRPGADTPTGRYFLAADFNRQTPLSFDQVDALSLTAGTAATRGLAVDEAAVYQFNVGSPPAASAGGSVTLTVTDAGGHTVLSASAKAGDLATTRVAYLPAGAYTVRWSAGPAAVVGDLDMLRLSDPVGPRRPNASSDTTQPTSPPPASPPPPPASPPAATSPPPTSSDTGYQYAGSSSGSTMSSQTYYF